MDRLSGLVIRSQQINSFYKFNDHQLAISDICQNKTKLNEISSVSYDSTVKVYDIEKMTLISSLSKHTKGIWTCDYSNAGSLFLTGGNDNSIILWDSNSYETLSIINKHEEVVYDVKFSTNGKYFSSCSKGTLCLWDLKNLKEPLSIIKDIHNEFIYSVNFIGFDKYIVSGFVDGYLILIDINNLSSYKKYILPCENNNSNSIYHISKFKTGQDDQILTSTADGSVYVWKLENGDLSENSKYQYFNSPLTSVNTSFDDNYITASCKDHSAAVWKTNEYNKISYSLVGHSDIVTCAEFVADDIIATASYDTSLRFWKCK